MSEKMPPAESQAAEAAGPKPWDSGEHVAPDPSLPVEAQLKWYRVASHVLLLNCSELVRRAAAAEADKELQRAAPGGAGDGQQPGLDGLFLAWLGEHCEIVADASYEESDLKFAFIAGHGAAVQALPAGDGRQAAVRQLLALKLDGRNGAGASDVRDYLRRLLAKVWLEEEEFDGKRPFGNSGWQEDVYKPMRAAGLSDGNIVTDDDDQLICAAIDAMCRGEA